MTDHSAAVPTPAENMSIVDALLRFGAGADDGDVSVLRSAFSKNAVVDFSRCGASIGLSFEPLGGIDAIVDFLAGTSRQQATSHVVSNARVRMTEDGAHLRALIDATHVVRGDQARRFEMMNWYNVDLVPSDGQWRINRMAIDNIWFVGDAAVLFVR